MLSEALIYLKAYIQPIKTEDTTNKQNINNSYQWSITTIKILEYGEMTLRIDKTIGPFYCQTALRLCLESRKLCERGECNKVAEICSYISTLCSKNEFETCRTESTICNKVSAFCKFGRATEQCKKAHIACEEAKKLCPQNNMVSGA